MILSCKNDLIDSFLEPVTTKSISIEDAKEWFEKSYLEKFNNFRYTSKSTHEREADWGRALYTEVKNKGKCVIVPIKYLNKYRPAFAAWDSKNDFVEKLLEYYMHPILEVLVVFNDDNDRTHAYLSQIAYDRYHLTKNRLDIDQYYGWFLKSDWNDHVLEAAYYEKGRQKLISKNGSSKARLALDCVAYYTGAAHYSYSYTDQDGAVVIVWQKEYAYYCFGPGSGAYANEDYPDEVEEGFIPGGGGETYTVPVTTNFNVKNAICNPGGADRSQMNQSLQNALFATGLANDITGFSWSKADALLKSIGANIDEFLPTLSFAGRTVGVVGGTFAGAGVLISGAKLYLGVTDGTGFTWDDDGWDVVQVGLAAAGGGILLFGGGVVAAVSSVVIGGVSIGISIYTERQEIQTKQQLRQAICN